MTQLGDVLAGTAPGRQHADDVTLFDSTGLAIQDLAIAKAAVKRADELDLPRLGPLDPSELLGKRSRTGDRFRLARCDDGPRGGADLMYGRLTIIDGKPDRLGLLPEPQEQAIPRENEMAGLHALYCLIDRETGRGVSLSIWDSREAMDASEERVGEQRSQAQANAAGTVVTIERMEVVNALERSG